MADVSTRGLMAATRGRAKFSGHGGLGAAGKRVASGAADNCDLLSEPGASIAITPGQRGFEDITIGAAWDEPPAEVGFFAKLFKGAPQGVDLDLGCFYELADGQRGVLQAFGNKFGRLDAPPWMRLSEDARSGEAEGDDEHITISGAHWDDVRRVLIYIYIYDGAPRWSAIKPRVMLDIPGENDLAVILSVHNDRLPVCAVGGLENVRGGIKLTNHTEYFPGHLEMDRAFGFGMPWGDGRK
ncbi:MAG TPA: Tellurium resistance protein TerA [Rhodospirillaceae bacterium]|jgi:tellurite resistance protein TerA|nr:Tellurium resistance protein TerA [Alphaproteobacteria bacterium]HBH26335.1 Tellurium resistance protein TerA [Rhodospirillaceae bacterium]